MGWIELTAAAFGLLCVWLTVRQSIWCWPTGLVMVCLYAWIFYEVRLYSDAALQLIYVVLQLYGWWFWLRGRPVEGMTPVARTGPAATAGWSVAGVAGTFALGWTMTRFTDADLPYWDAATTVLSLVAQYLMARKLLESWLFWIAVDVLAVGIYTAKSLYLTAGLYAVFLGLAVAGWFAWQRSLQARMVAASA